MYEFYYKYLKPTYGEGLKLCFTDTDSLCYEVKTENVFLDMFRDKHLFDLSNYPIDHPCHDSSNQKAPGFFKDEVGGEVISEFVGLRAKMYSFSYAVKQTVTLDNARIIYNVMKDKQIAKGIAKATIKHDLHHDMYSKCLFDENTKMCEMNCIRSEKHQLGVFTINKRGLSAFDDKRYVLPNGCDTLAFGHHRIPNQNML